MNIQQQNDLISKITGAVSAVFGWLTTGGTFEIFKVVIFAIIGGVVSFYVNKFLKKLHN